MILKNKIKKIVLMNFGILIALSISFSYNFNNSIDNSEDSNFDKRNIKLSKVSGKIYINNNWSAARTAGICTGSGISSDPYVIEDLEIDGGGVGSCIWIENSNDYFMIVNCSLSNAEDDTRQAGISLQNVSNGQLINNTFTTSRTGIYLHISNNTSLIGNSIILPNEWGFNIVNCENILAYLNNIRGSYIGAFFQDTTHRFYSERKYTYTYNGHQFSNYLCNYWSSVYTGDDNNNDGIGDTTLIFTDGDDIAYIDFYPLMEPIENYEILGLTAEEAIPGYDFLIIIGIISVISILMVKRLRK